MATVMKNSRTFILTGILAILVTSCIDRDILNISDTLNLHPSYSIPIGTFDYDINGYLGSLDTATYSWPDSLYYDDVLYPNPLPAVNFTSVDSFAFNMIPESGGSVRSIEFVVPLSNGYPTEVSAQVYFLANGSPQPVDSVFRDGPCVVPAAEVDDEGLVVRPYMNIYTVVMPAEFVLKLGQVNWIMVSGWVDTGKQCDHKIKFYSGYQVDLHIGLRIELLYNTGDL